MNFLNNMKLARKLALMVLFPVVVMVGFAAVKSISALSLRQTTVQLQSMTALSTHASNLVHEISLLLPQSVGPCHQVLFRKHRHLC